MKKGFTLVELMAVIVIISILVVGVVPVIIKQVSGQKGHINDSTKELIYNATELYVSNDKEKYQTDSGNVYCVSLEKLVKAGLLKKKIINFTNGKSIPLTKEVKVTVNGYNEFEYNLLDNEECVEYPDTSKW